MKNTRRLLVLALVLIVALSPVALAGETYGSITLSNFRYELDGGKPVDVNATIRAGYGGSLPDGSARLDFLMEGDGRTAFAGTASVYDRKLKAALEKSRYRFEIPLDDLEELFFSGSGYSLMYPLMYAMPYGSYYDFYDFMGYGYRGGDGPDPEDFQKLGDLIAHFGEYAKRDLDPAHTRERDRKLYEILKPEGKGLETTELFGQSVELYRFEFSFSGEEALRRYYEASFEADPELKALYEETAALSNAFDPQEDEGDEDESDEKAVDADEALLDRVLEESGLDGITCVIWSDTETISAEGSKAQKTALTLHIKDAVDEYGMPVEYSVPINSSLLESEAGLRLQGDMTFAPYEGESTTLTFSGSLAMPQRSGGTMSNIVVRLDMTSENGGVELTSRLKATHHVDAAGVADLSAGFSGSMNGQDFDLRCAYDGKTITPDENSGTVSFSYDIPSGSPSGKPAKGSVRFDALVEFSPYEKADYAAYQDLQPVNPLAASRKVMDQVGGDLSGAMMQGVGALMQTHGLSAIIGGLMNVA